MEEYYHSCIGDTAWLANSEYGTRTVPASPGTGVGVSETIRGDGERETGDQKKDRTGASNKPGKEREALEIV